MGFTKFTTDVENISALPNSPSSAGYTAQQLKVLFDKGDIDEKTYLNGLIDELEALTSASNLGAKKLQDGETASNVQAEIEYLQEQLQGIVLEQIPDGTVTEEKLEQVYRNTLAKKNEITDIGEIRDFSSEVTKDGYLLCDGSFVNKIDYPDMVDKLADGLGKYHLNLGVGSNCEYGNVIKYGEYYIYHKYTEKFYKYSTDLQNWTTKTIEADFYIKDMEVINGNLFAITSYQNGALSKTKIYKFIDIESPILKYEHTGEHDSSIRFLWDNNGNIITCVGALQYSNDWGDTWTVPSVNVRYGDGCYLDGYFYLVGYNYGNGSLGTLAYKISASNPNTVTTINMNISVLGYMNTKLISKNNKIYLYNGKRSYGADNKIYVGTNLTDMTAITDDVYTNVQKDIANNELFIVQSSNVEKIKEGADELEIIYVTSNSFPDNSGYNSGKGIANKIDEEYFEVPDDENMYMTTSKKIQLPNITNSDANGYHYLKVSEVD